MPQFTVIFRNDQGDYQPIGPFYSEEAAQDYADEQNSKLAEAGIPTSVASYSILY
jgi:hypothetical protein